MVEGAGFVIVGLGTSEECIHFEEFEDMPDSAVASRFQRPQPDWREIGTDVAGN